MIEIDGNLSLMSQCDLLGLNRSSLYYKPVELLVVDIRIMNLIDRIRTQFPGYGIEKIRDRLKLVYNMEVSYKRVYSFMNKMRLIRKVRKNHHYHKYSYLLKGMDITRSNQCWSIDITYLGINNGHTFMFAIIDWFSRMVLGYIVSNKIDSPTVARVIEEAILLHGVPEIINSDNGSEFASGVYLELLDLHKVGVSMNRKGKPADNIAIERFFRSLKSEKLHYEEYESDNELIADIDFYIEEYNCRRTHKRHKKVPVLAFKEGF